MENNNNNFYGYSGYINRKNYTVNLFILVALYISIMLVNWNSFTQYTPYKFLSELLMHIAFCFQIIIVFCSLSVVYRRIADITKNKTENIKNGFKTLFIVLYVIPIIYFLGLRPILNFSLFDLAFLLLSFVSIIFAIILCFIKGNNA